MKYPLTIISLLFLLLGASAQDNGTSSINLQLQLDSLKGTYEIKYKSRNLQLLPSNLAAIIKANRHETETKVVALNENTELIVYPISSISNGVLNQKTEVE